MREKEQELTLELTTLKFNVESVKSRSSTSSSGDAAADAVKAGADTGVGLISPKWQDHVAKMEVELQALKATLKLIPMSSGGATFQDQEEMEERMIDIVQENRRLKLNNKKLAQQVLDMVKDDTGMSLGFTLFSLASIISF